MTLRHLNRPHPRALRVAAAAFLVAVALGDLAVDVDCDPLPPTNGELTLTVADDADADACATGCIPDCFCCSRSLGAGLRVEPPVPAGVVLLVAVAEPGLPPGVSCLTEHPPRAQA